MNDLAFSPCNRPSEASERSGFFIKLNQLFPNVAWRDGIGRPSALETAFFQSRLCLRRDSRLDLVEERVMGFQQSSS